MNPTKLFWALIYAIGLILIFALIAYIYWGFVTKNSVGLQAIAPLIIGIPTLLLAAIATSAASDSATTSRKQVEVATSQAEAARAHVAAANEQLALAKAQHEDQKLQMEVQRRIDAAREIVAFQRLKAEDEATRPRFEIVGPFFESSTAHVEIRNCGCGEAIGLEIKEPRNTAFRKVAILKVGEGSRGVLDLEEMKRTPAICTFTSQMGSKWTVDLRFSKSDNRLIEENVRVERPYEISKVLNELVREEI